MESELTGFALSQTTLATPRGRSPNIWRGAAGVCPLGSIANGAIQNFVRSGGGPNAFANLPLIGTQTTQIGYAQGKVFATASGAVAPVKTLNSVILPGGALAFTTGTDNNSSSYADAYPNFALTGLASNSGQLWFEAELAVSTIAVSTLGWFLGLAEVDLWTLATGVPFNGSDAITNAAAAVGFAKGEDALGVVDCVYSDRATAFTNAGGAGGTTRGQGADTSISAAYTWLKLGMVYTPGGGANCIRFFANNIELSTKISQTTLTGLTNLDAGNLGLIFSVIADASISTNAAYLRWWDCVQLLV